MRPSGLTAAATVGQGQNGAAAGAATTTTKVVV
jgi:hypothetical protein